MKVIVYGIGKRYYSLFGCCEYFDMGIIANEIEIVGFSDSNSDIYGRKIIYNGTLFEVRSIWEFAQNDFDKIMITTKDYYEEIENRLVEGGCKPEQIFVIDDIFEPYLELINCANYPLLNENWLWLSKEKEKVTLFFNLMKYKNIAVLGTGLLLVQLLHLFENIDVKVRYLIDSGNNDRYKELPMFGIGSELPTVDIIVVATMENYMDIERELCENTSIEVISIQELTYKTVKYIHLSKFRTV
ncbi:MAG: hypothetical protein HFH79_03010 [Lachnospiraceae bacterium]|jgi:hypothetical protein|nr:hypothetical protein [Lachnospiraceae bacterium]